MRGEDDRPAPRHLALVVDEDRAAPLELSNDVAVVDDLLADVDGSPEPLERALDRLDGTFHPGAVPPRRGEENSLHQTAGHGSQGRPCGTEGTEFFTDETGRGPPLGGSVRRAAP
jgi:hypothetical protein